MQSGMAKTDKWLLEPKQDKNTRFIDPLMGWTGSTDMNLEMILTFDNQEDAVAYAEREGIDYEVIPSHRRKLIIKAYADNFKYKNPAA